MEEDYVMIPGSGTKKIIRDVKGDRDRILDYSMSVIVSAPCLRCARRFEACSPPHSVHHARAWQRPQPSLPQIR